MSIVSLLIRSGKVGQRREIQPPRVSALLFFFATLFLVLTLPSTAQRCGCEDTCNSTILNAIANDNGDTCQDRIDSRITNNGDNETEACRFAATRFPLACNPGCHPDKCGQDVPPLCNCAACTPEVWSTNVFANFDCGFIIINGLSTKTELEACQATAEQYPAECGACHPYNCTNAVPTSAPTPLVVETPPPTLPPFEAVDPDARYCGCAACTDEVLENVYSGSTCRARIAEAERIQNVTHVEACWLATHWMPPHSCQPACNPVLCNTMHPTLAPVRPDPEHCGCYDCNDTILNRTVAGFTCLERIQYMQTAVGGRKTEEEACDFVATEFAGCRPCGPRFCDGQSGTGRLGVVFTGLLLSGLTLSFL